MCDCKIEHGAPDVGISSKILYCPLHAAAPDLKAENARLRAALEAAPEWFKGMRLAYLRDEQVKWYYGLRDKALKGGKE